MNNKQAFRKGMQDGVPIALGYFAVAFTLGIAARNAGVTALQSFVISMTNVSSTGEYVGFTGIADKVTYLEMALMILIANARYVLLSCSLSQKFSSTMKFFHRLLFGFCVTDEIFGISIKKAVFALILINSIHFTPTAQLSFPFQHGVLEHTLAL